MKVRIKKVDGGVAVVVDIQSLQATALEKLYVADFTRFIVITDDKAEGEVLMEAAKYRRVVSMSVLKRYAKDVSTTKALFMPLNWNQGRLVLKDTK